MAKKDDNVKSVEDRIAAIEAGLTEFAEWRRRVSTNWKRFVQTGAVGPASLKKGSDGELGAMNLNIVLGILCLVIVGSFVFAGVTVNPGQTDSYISDGSKFRIDTSGNVYTKGAITCDGIISSGGGVYTNGGVSITNVNGAVTVSNLNTVALGATTLNGTLTVGGATLITGAGTYSNTTSKFYGKYFQATAGGGYTDAATSTNTLVGDVVISGASTLSGTKTISGSIATFTCPVTLGGGSNIFNIGGTTGTLGVAVVNGTNFVYFK